MLESPPSPIAALSWEIWLKNRKWAGAALGIILFGYGLDWLRPGTMRPDNHNLAGALFSVLMVLLLVLVFGIFTYTEFNPQYGSTGFPRRLFVLPVSSFVLVAVPIGLGVAGIELAYFAEVYRPGHPAGELVALKAVKFGAFMVVYQSGLWMLSRLGAMRAVVMGLLGFWFILTGSMTLFPENELNKWVIEKTAIERLVVLAVLSFCAAWAYVAYQRSGGGSRRSWLDVLLSRTASVVREKQPFRSPAAAQFWLEWRRSGVVLPVIIAGLLLFGVLPVSWNLRDDGSATLRILFVVMAAPLLLGLFVGKGFSKPDFWAADLSLPGFVAVRPLRAIDIVVSKMKVAAWSAAASWVITGVFLSVWLSGWADVESLKAWWPMSLTGALFIAALMLMTWSLLVRGLWSGLSGSRRLYVATCLPYAFLPPLVLIALIMLGHGDTTGPDWIFQKIQTFQSELLWIGATAVAVKLCVAALSWRRVVREFVLRYFACWLACTSCLVALAVLVSRHYAENLEKLLVCAAVLLMPMARVGLAPAFLERNRHQP